MRQLGVLLAALAMSMVGCKESGGGSSAASSAGSAAASAGSAAASAAKTAVNTAAGSAAAVAASGAAAAASTVASLAAVKGLDQVAEAAGDLAALGKDDGEGVTAEQYEALVLGVSACQVDDNGIERECPAYKALREARKGRNTMMKDWGGAMAGIGRKHIKHASPAVRIQAASLMGSIFGTSAESQAALVEAAAGEQNMQVLKQMLRTLSSSVGKNPAVAKLMLGNAANADAKVRMEVVSVLTSTWARGSEGTLEKAMEMVEKDADPEVRTFACRRLGERADEMVLPLLQKLTQDPAADPKLYSACFRGLVAMWSSPLAHTAPSQKAYALTLKLMAKKPRSNEHPPWTAIPAMEWAKNEKFQAAAPWFKPAELVAAIADVVSDPQANWLARTSGVDAMSKLGGTKADFEKLLAVYAPNKDKPGTDKRIYEKVEKALAEAK